MGDVFETRLGGDVFGPVSNFKYVGIIVTEENDASEEIRSWITAESRSSMPYCYLLNHAM